jgi:hypothetical protein
MRGPLLATLTLLLLAGGLVAASPARPAAPADRVVLAEMFGADW